MENFGGPILQKYAEINTKGKERLVVKNFELFTGFPLSLQKRFITAVEFSPESTAAFDRQVKATLEEIERAFKLKFALAHRDFPLHSTILEGLNEEALDTSTETFSELQKEAELEWSEHEITFDYILLDGGNLLLVAKEIPDFVLEAREQLAETYTEHAMKPLLIKNLLHATAARITELPDDFDPIAYRSAITELRHSISSDPLVLTINGTAQDRSYDFLTATQPTPRA